MGRPCAEGATIVVATKDGIDSTTVDFDVGAGVGSCSHKGVLGTTKEFTDTDTLHMISICTGRENGDRGLGDFGYRARSGAVDGITLREGPVRSLIDKAYGVVSHRTADRIICIAGNQSVVDVVAITTTIDGADADHVGCRSSSDLNGRTIGTSNSAGDVVTTINGRDCVAIDDSHSGIAVDIGHTTATEH